MSLLESVLRRLTRKQQIAIVDDHLQTTLQQLNGVERALEKGSIEVADLAWEEEFEDTSRKAEEDG